MTIRTALSICLLLAAPFAAAADAPSPTAQFDFLLGRWTVDVRPKVNGLVAMIHGTPRLVGTWVATRSADGAGIEDELSIVDGSGNPTSLVRTRRVWSPSDAIWTIDGVDAIRSRASRSVAHWHDGEMRVEGRSTDAEGNPIRTRTRFRDIGPDAFTMQQDRSSDDGQTWDEAVVTIAATRVAPAH